jgi:di/tripeptidase
MGPTAYDIHTTRERADIASTENGWYFLKEILAAL